MTGVQTCALPISGFWLGLASSSHLGARPLCPTWHSLPGQIRLGLQLSGSGIPSGPVTRPSLLSLCSFTPADHLGPSTCPPRAPEPQQQFPGARARTLLSRSGRGPWSWHPERPESTPSSLQVLRQSALWPHPLRLPVPRTLPLPRPRVQLPGMSHGHPPHSCGLAQQRRGLLKAGRGYSVLLGPPEFDLGRQRAQKSSQPVLVPRLLPTGI